MGIGNAEVGRTGISTAIDRFFDELSDGITGRSWYVAGGSVVVFVLGLYLFGALAELLGISAVGSTVRQIGMIVWLFGSVFAGVIARPRRSTRAVAGAIPMWSFALTAYTVRLRNWLHGWFYHSYNSVGMLKRPYIYHPTHTTIENYVLVVCGALLVGGIIGVFSGRTCDRLRDERTTESDTRQPLMKRFEDQVTRYREGELSLTETLGNRFVEARSGHRSGLTWFLAGVLGTTGVVWLFLHAVRTGGGVLPHPVHATGIAMLGSAFAGLIAGRTWSERAAAAAIPTWVSALLGSTISLRQRWHEWFASAEPTYGVTQLPTLTAADIQAYVLLSLGALLAGAAVGITVGWLADRATGGDL